MSQTDLARERGRQLYEARRARRPIAPFTDRDPHLTQAEAYAIQGHFVDALLADGGHVVGYKLGLTSRPMQRMLGVDEPDYGPVLSTMVHDDGVELALGDFIAPKIEAEIGLVLADELQGPGVTRADAAAAIRGAVPALELVDSRIVDWRIRLADTIADLASSAAIVLGGGGVVPLDGIDARLVGMVVSRNGELVDTGAGAAALGDPVGAVAWVANTLAAYDTTLQAGHVIMTGSLHSAFPPGAGDEVTAEFDHLGTVTCRFT